MQPITIIPSNSRFQNSDYRCDGTNDEVQINNAIQSLVGIGGIIKLLEGTYYLGAASESILFNTGCNNIVLEGQGAATILRVPDGHASSMSLIKITGESDTHLHDITIKNLFLDGNETGVTGEAYNGISSEYADRVTIDSVTIQEGAGVGNGYGMLFQNGYDAVVKNCTFFPWGNTDIEFRTTDRLSVLGCRFLGESGDDGRLEIYANCDRITIDGCTFSQAGFQIATIVDALTAQSVKVTNNIFISTVAYTRVSVAAAFAACDGLLVSDNMIDVYGKPVAINALVSNAIFENNFMRSAMTGCVSFSNTVGSVPSNLLFQGNQFIASALVANTSYALESLANPDLTNVVFKNNIFQKDAAAAGTVNGVILPTSTSTRFERNDFRGFATAIILGENSDATRLTNNFYSGNSADVTDGGTNTVVE